MNIKPPLFAACTLLLLSGCSTGVVPMSENTYMIEHRGSSLSTQASNEAKCFDEANRFCADRGLVMIPVSTTGRNGLAVPFGHGGDAKLVFKAVQPGSAQAKEVTAEPNDQSASLGQQLIDLQKAKNAGALTDAEYEAQKARLLAGK